MKRRLFLGLVVLGLSLATASSQAIPSTSKPAALAAAPVTIPFELVTRHVMLQVRVDNSRPLWFALDTGDRFAIIDLDRAKELGLKLDGQIKMGGAGAETPTGTFVKDSTFTIPGLAGFSQPLNLALPIARMAPRFGQDFDGIIGSEFIKEFVLELDYQARLIRLHDKTTFAYTGPGESIPINVNSAGHPTIEAEVTPIGSEPVKGRFVLDIGSGGALALHSPFVSERKLLGSNLKTIKAIGVGGAGGPVTGQFGRVSELTIGKFKISNPITLFSEDKAGALANSALLGNIGGQITSKFRLFLDYSHNRIIFEPNVTFAKPFDRAFSGLALIAEGKDYRTFRIREILENSPGSEAGLQTNDIIAAIDGKPAAELTLTTLNEIFERPAAYKLTVQRGDQTLQITLTPRKMV